MLLTGRILRRRRYGAAVRVCRGCCAWAERLVGSRAGHRRGREHAGDVGALDTPAAGGVAFSVDVCSAGAA